MNHPVYDRLFATVCSSPFKLSIVTGIVLSFIKLTEYNKLSLEYNSFPKSILIINFFAVLNKLSLTKPQAFQKIKNYFQLFDVYIV